MLQERYRRDYDGEFVIVETVVRNGTKKQTREWIDNPIENQHVSGRAACIGSDKDRDQFKYPRLERHRGGIRGSRRLQTYATGRIWEDMRLDFYVSTESKTVRGLAKVGYCENSVVYSTPNECLRHPGQLFIVPYAPRLHDLALPLYLAAFDGHQEVFLIGYGKEIYLDPDWIKDVDLVIKTYHATNFIFVGRAANSPDEFRYNRNFSVMDIRKWISYCDI